MQNPPETPESVAFSLFMLILERGDAMLPPTNMRPMSEHYLDLYAQCLAVVNGGRDVSRGPH